MESFNCGASLCSENIKVDRQKCSKFSFLIFHFSFFILSALLLTTLVFAEKPKIKKLHPVYADVLSNNVNIRAGKGVNFEILGKISKADKIVVIGQTYDWYKIKLPKTALSFVHKDYVNEGFVSANKLRVRAGAGFNFNVLGILKKGQLVKILKKEGEWLKIIPTEDCSGWVKKDYLQLSDIEVIPDEPTSPFIIQKSQLKIGASGIIDDLGKIYGRKGTHKLISEGKILYYLTSESIDLNLYVYQMVYVTGRLLDLKNPLYPVINVEEIKLIQ